MFLLVVFLFLSGVLVLVFTKVALVFIDAFGDFGVVVRWLVYRSSNKQTLQGICTVCVHGQVTM